MCRLCEKKPVYEFTNKRRLCSGCFVNYFHKKVLYAVRKFNLIKSEDVIGYKQGKDLRDAVLETVLKFISNKTNCRLVKLPSKKATKIAESDSLDSESGEIINLLVHGKAQDLANFLPVKKKTVKPLYLFLDEEILLYAKIKNLKFRQENSQKNKIGDFLNELEKKHPEVKRAAVNSLLELYKQN